MSAVFSRGKRFLTVGMQSASEPSLPSLRSQALNFTKALARSAVSVARGNPLKVSDATRDQRRAKCLACSFYRKSDGRCSHVLCGCPVSKRGIIESKTELFAEYCPKIPMEWGRGEIA